MAYTPNEWSCGQTVTAEKLNNIERGVAEVNSEYTPTTWQCGDLITAEKMNKIEQGIANAGGGGSSDFSTAKLTIANTIPQTFNWECPWYIDDPEFSCSYGDIAVRATHTETFDIIMYKGKAEIRALHTGAQLSLSGNIEDDGGDYYIITGDCTITIS